MVKEAFLKNWEKIVLQAGSIDSQSGEKDYQLNRKKEIVSTNKNFALIGAAILLFFSTVYFFINSLPANFIASAAILLIIKISGMAVSVLLLIYEIDKSNAFVKSICNAGKQTNCNAVLQSKASKILGMSWSEAGFFYFASTLLFFLFPGINFSTKVFILSLANCLAAPYILFSVYYQWKVVKQWCPLCLTVQAVLLMELAWAIINFWQSPFLPTTSLFSALLLPFIFCLLLPFAVWFVIKPLLLKAKNYRVYEAGYKRLLYNPDTFNNLLQQQASAPAGYENIGITIGNPDAVNTIIKVCNPYCGPCAKAHSVIEEILQNNKDVKLKLIFTASNEVYDERGMVARHLLAISGKQNALKTQALDDWYLADKKDYKAFAEKYPMNGEIKEQEKQVEEMSQWCKEAQITGTPTFFINGKQLPETYGISELNIFYKQE